MHSVTVAAYFESRHSSSSPREAIEFEMASPQLLHLAQQGDPDAIAALMNRALQPQHMTVTARREQETLQLWFQAVQLPERDRILHFVRKGFMNLGVANLKIVQLYGQTWGDPTPQWQAAFDLSQRIERAETAVHSSQLQAEFAPTQMAASRVGAKPAATATTVLPAPSVSYGTSVSADIGTLKGQQIAIGHKITQVTNHGGVVYLSQDGQAPTPKRRSAPQPSQYCRAFPQLLDRQLETERAIAALQAHHPVEIYGESGLGKTVLWRVLAHRPEVMAAFPEGIIYRSVHQQPWVDVLQLLFDDFYEYDSPIPVKTTDAEIRRALEHHHALIVLDDLDWDRSSVEALLNALPNLTFGLAAQECHFWGEGEAIALPGLPQTDALALMERQLGRSLTAIEQPNAIALWQLLQGHPYRILQAVARIGANHSLAQEVQHLQQMLPDQRTVQALATQPESERRVLALLATLGKGTIAIEQLAVLADPLSETVLPGQTPAYPSDALQSLLQRLTHQGLVRQTGDRHFSLAPNLIGPLQQSWNLTGWGQRLVDHCLQWVSHEATLAQLYDASDMVLSVWQWTVQQQQWSEVLRLGPVLESVLTLQKRWALGQDVVIRQLAVAQQVGDRAAEAWAWHQLGTQALCLEDPFTAHTYLSEALQIREQIGDAAGAEISRHNLAFLLAPPVPETIQTPPAHEVRTAPSRAGLLTGMLLGMAFLGGAGLWWLGPRLLSPIAVRPMGPTAADTVLQSLDIPLPQVLLAIELNPQDINFGERLINTAQGASMTVEVTNRSGRRIILPKAELTGDRADQFKILSDRCAGVPLNTDQSCRIDLNFTPQQPGPHQARLVIPRPGSDTAAGTVVLNGAGLAPSAEPQLRLSPRSLEFGRRELGQTHSLRLRLSNAGSGSLQITAVEVIGDQADDFQINQNACQGQSLASEASPCEVEVQFAPQAAGGRQAQLRIRYNGSDRPALVDLAGEGVAPVVLLPEIQLNRSQIQFGELEVGRRSDRETVILQNVGAAPLQISGIALQGDHPEAFALLGQDCKQATLAPDQQCTVALQFNPDAEGDRRATLTITHTAAESPAIIRLEGRGVIPVPPVEILGFFAKSTTLELGQETTLCYDLAHAATAEIQPAVGSVAPPQGCVVVQPQATTTYTLVAQGQSGSSVQETVTVTVKEATPTPSPTTNLPIEWPIQNQPILQDSISAPTGKEPEGPF